MVSMETISKNFIWVKVDNIDLYIYHTTLIAFRKKGTLYVDKYQTQIKKTETYFDKNKTPIKVYLTSDEFYKLSEILIKTN